MPIREDFVKPIMVGLGIPRVDAFEKVKGKAIYADDIRFPDMLYGKVLRSKLPHARIVNIDVSQAAGLRGVKAVMTGKDIPATYGPPGLGLRDQPFFAFEKVRYIGEPIAAVVAIDEDVAQEAVDLIEVDYEELPAVFDPVLAMMPNAPILHEQLHTYQCPPAINPIPNSNICHYAKIRLGNIQQGFKESDFVFENNFKTQMVQHCSLEPHTAIAQMDPNGRIMLWVANDSPFACRRELAEALTIPISKIRVMVPFMGGGFGGKGGLTVEPICVALCMKANGKPVKVSWSRREEFESSLVRHPTTIDLKVGVKRDGTLMAFEEKTVWDTGAYSEKGPTICSRATSAASGPYRIPHLHIDGYCVYTNKVVSGALRGFGICQVTWACESQMDIIARELGMDPLELRLKNCFKNGDRSPTGQILQAVGIEECLKKVAEKIGWNKTIRKKDRGFGIACMHKWQAMLASSALVTLNEDGTVFVSLGTVEIGQGAYTIFSQIVSEELGVPLKNIIIGLPDTDYSPYDSSTTGSRSTFMMGNAVKRAAQDAKKQLLTLAAEKLEVDPDDLEAEGGRVFVKGSPGRGIEIERLAQLSILSKSGPILGKGSYIMPPKPVDRETGQGYETIWMYGAHAVEVKVDRDTGEVTVLRVVAAHDVGKAINPLNCEGQIEGSVVMGMGTSFWEEMVLEGGKVLNANLRDYKIPTALNVPEIFPILVEEKHPEGPYGAKGLGEPALAPTAPAIANAIYDAIGVRIKDLPMTSEKILRALKEQRRNDH